MPTSLASLGAALGAPMLKWGLFLLLLMAAAGGGFFWGESLAARHAIESTRKDAEARIAATQRPIK